MPSNVYISDLRTTGSFRGRIGVFDRNELTGELNYVSNELIETPFDGGMLCISYDGKNVYMINSSNTSISTYSRNISTGELTFVGTILTGNAPSDICISPDDKNIYVSNQGNDFISIYNRDSLTGELTSGGTVVCEYSPQGICVSLDGKNVYASNLSTPITGNVIGAITVYERNIVTGYLTPIQTIYTGVSDTDPTKICVSYDGTSLYVVNRNTDTIQSYERDISTGLLTPLQSIVTQNSPTDICISADDKSIYVVNSLSDTISIYNRNTSTKILTSNGTIATEFKPTQIKISSDLKNVYVINSGINSQTISTYNRNISTNALTLMSTSGFFGDPLSGICIYPLDYNFENPYCVSGAGLESINGTYDYISTPAYDYNNGYWQKTNDSTKTFGYDYANQWWVIKSGSSIAYGMGDGTANAFSPPPTNGILWGGGAISPPPTITQGSCNIATALMVNIQPYGVVSGNQFTTQPEIKIVDLNGNVVSTATNLIEATITIVNGSGSLSGTTTVSAVNGYATFTDLTFTGDASFYLTFTATGLTPVDSNEIATLTPVSILMETQPVAGSSGDQFLTQPVVKIVNWLNEIVPTYSDDVVCTLVVVSGSPVLTGTTSVTPSSGYATYTDLVATGSGSFYLQFTSGSLNQVDSNTIYFLPDPGNPNPPIPVKPKRSYIPLSVPTANDMEINEFAINVVDKKGYVCDSNGVVHQVFDGSQGVSSIIAGTGISVNNSTGNVTISTIASSPSLEQLTDVQITNKQNGQILRYLVSAQKWVNSNTIDGGNF